MNMIKKALEKLNLRDYRSYISKDRVQISGVMESGEEIHVMQSNKGWHVGFGEMSPYNAPHAVDEYEAAQIIGGA